jgi:hypothetical protein
MEGTRRRGVGIRWAEAPSSSRPCSSLRSSSRVPYRGFGGPSFDPEAVGFVTDPDEPNAFFFDTTKPGNDNRGHEGPAYGTDLPVGDRADLLEYLKSL